MDTFIKRAVVTGATGMIGIALTEFLIRQNIEVTALVRPGSDKVKFIDQNKHVRIKEGDLSHLKELDGWDGIYDAFFHLGWDGTFGSSRNDMYLQNQNIRYTLDAVELAYRLGCQVFIGAGSQAEYGRITETGRKLEADTPAFPENGYGIGKLAAGQMSRLRCKELGIRHVWVRILSVYGPYDSKKTMVMSSVLTLLKGCRPVYSMGEQLWDYLYAGDAGRALYYAAEWGRDGSVYPLGSGEVKPLKDYILQIRDAVNPEAEIGLGEIPYTDKQVMYLCADISNLVKDTGFLPEITFQEGIEKTLEWYRGNRIHEND